MRRFSRSHGPEDVQDLFASAVSDGNIPKTKALILRYKTAIDINHKTPLYEHTPMMNACSNGDLNMVKLLVDFFKDKIWINLQDGNLRSALSFAIKGRHTQLVEFIVESFRFHIDINLQDATGNTPPLLAFETGQIGLVELFLNEFGGAVDPTIENDNTLTLVQGICRIGDMSLLKIIVAHNKYRIDINKPNANNETLLQIAQSGEHKAILVYLVQQFQQTMSISNKNQYDQFFSLDSTKFTGGRPPRSPRLLRSRSGSAANSVITGTTSTSSGNRVSLANARAALRPLSTTTSLSVPRGISFDDNERESVKERDFPSSRKRKAERDVERETESSDVNDSVIVDAVTNSSANTTTSNVTSNTNTSNVTSNTTTSTTKSLSPPPQPSTSDKDKEGPVYSPKRGKYTDELPASLSPPRTTLSPPPPSLSPKPLTTTTSTTTSVVSGATVSLSPPPQPLVEGERDTDSDLQLQLRQLVRSLRLKESELASVREDLEYARTQQRIVAALRESEREREEERERGDDGEGEREELRQRLAEREREISELRQREKERERGTTSTALTLVGTPVSSKRPQSSKSQRSLAGSVRYTGGTTLFLSPSGTPAAPSTGMDTEELRLELLRVRGQVELLQRERVIHDSELQESEETRRDLARSLGESEEVIASLNDELASCQERVRELEVALGLCDVREGLVSVGECDRMLQGMEDVRVLVQARRKELKAQLQGNSGGLGVSLSLRASRPASVRVSTPSQQGNTGDSKQCVIC